MNPIESKNIVQLFDSLPDNKKSEVYDFIKFLKVQTENQRIKEKEIVKKVYGLTRGSKLTTEMFSKMKVKELGLEDK